MTIEEQVAAYKLDPISQQKRWDDEAAERARWGTHGVLKNASYISREMEYELNCDFRTIPSDETW